MLSANEQKIIREVLDELAEIRRKLYWGYVNTTHSSNPPATADKSIATVLHALVNVAYNTLNQMRYFDENAERGLQMADTLKRILRGENKESEWEALTQTPTYVENTKPFYGQPDWVNWLGVDWGNDKGTFTEYIKRVDEEIEKGILSYPHEIVSFAAGSWVRCNYCESPFKIVEDGRMPHHEIIAPRQTGPNPGDVEQEPETCIGSGQFLSLAIAKPTIEPKSGRIFRIEQPERFASFHEPFRSILSNLRMKPEDIPAYAKGTCRGCEGIFALNGEGMIPEHGSLKGHYGGDNYKAPCAGSGLPPSDSAKRHGFCGICGETLALQDGLIPSHQTHASSRAEKCEGSGTRPVSASQVAVTPVEEEVEESYDPGGKLVDVKGKNFYVGFPISRGSQDMLCAIAENLNLLTNVWLPTHRKLRHNAILTLGPVQDWEEASGYILRVRNNAHIILRPFVSKSAPKVGERVYMWLINAHLVDRSIFDPGFASKGICSVCKKEWLLDLDGTIPGHSLDTVFCDGSHKEPVILTSPQENEKQTQQTTEDEHNPPDPPSPESKS